MQLIQFFAAYFLFLLASSILITSFFCITRGFTEVMPDGTIKRYGKILKGYYFFWFKEKRSNRLYYTGDQLEGLVHRMQEFYAETIILAPDTDHFKTTAAIYQAIPLLRHKLEIKFDMENLPGDTVAVKVYEDDPVYVFPDWLRTVMAGCITCTPTVYGNIVYWTAILILRKTILYSALFGCFGSPAAGIIFVWLAYWISLAWLNTLLWKLYDQ